MSDVEPVDVTRRDVIDLVRDTVPEDGRFEPSEFRGELRIIIEPRHLREVCRVMRDTEPYYFLHLSDITAVDYPDRDGPRFDVIYQLYSLKLNQRIRLRLRVDEDEPVPSLTPLWKTANWLERECYDMFGVKFGDHPNLERILMPKATRSHPLRKDYPLQPRKNFQQRRPEVAQQAEEWEVDYGHHPR